MHNILINMPDQGFLFNSLDGATSKSQTINNRMRSFHVTRIQHKYRLTATFLLFEQFNPSALFINVWPHVSLGARWISCRSVCFLRFLFRALYTGHKVMSLRFCFQCFWSYIIAWYLKQPKHFFFSIMWNIKLLNFIQELLNCLLLLK